MEKIECLDIIFYGSSSLTNVVSTTIQVVQEVTVGDGSYSHVALAVNKEFIPSLQVKDDGFYLWEAGVGVDEEDNNLTFGVQVNKLSLENSFFNPYKISLGKLKNNPLKRKEGEKDEEFNKRIQKIKNDLVALHKEYLDYPFEYSAIDCAGFIYPILRKCTCGIFNTKNIICSEFVAVVLKRLGVLDPNLLANEMIPVNFSNISTCTTFNKKFLKEDVVSEIICLK